MHVRRPDRKAVVYLLGGAPRTAKTTIAAAIARRHGIGWVSTDWVRNMLKRTVPAYDECTLGQEPDSESACFFPYLRDMVHEIAWTTDRYLVEGIPFLPRDAVKLASEVRVQACFLGVGQTTFREVVRHGARTPWHNTLPAVQQQLLPQWITGWSGKVEAECRQMGVPYVDIRAGIDRTVTAVERAFRLY